MVKRGQVNELNSILGFINPAEFEKPLPRNLIGDPERFK
jgi:hypothetical protein